MIYDLLSWLAENLITLWFFRSLRAESRGVGYRILAMLLFLCLLPVYLASGYVPSMVIRYLMRWVVVTIFLRLFWKEIALWNCVYFSALFTSILVAMQTILPLLDQNMPDQSPHLLFKVVSILVEFAGVTLVSHFVPFNQITRLQPIQPAVLLGVTALILYSKSAMKAFLDGRFLFPAETIMYPLVVLLLSLAVLTAFDRFCVLTEEQKRQAMIELGRDYQYKNLQAQLAAQKDVQRLYHDMKNHLLTLGQSASHRQQDYIEQLLGHLEGYQDLFRTGSETLDGLLHAKQLEARKQGVRLAACLDLSQAGFLAPVDICAIFGNAVDNAIEAAVQLPEESERFVNLKSDYFANQLVVSISNRCLRTPVPTGDGRLPDTTKRDRTHHGIGMESIRRALARYKGTLSFDTETGGRFTLKMMIPLDVQN